MSTFYLDRNNFGFKPGKSTLDIKLVRSDDHGLLASFTFLVSCLPIMLFVLLVIGYLLVTALGFLSRGVITEARVEECVYEPPANKSNGHLELTYAYISSGRPVVKQNEWVIHNFANCDTVPVGSKIQIQYMPDSTLPQSQVVDARLRRSALDEAGPICGLVFMLIFSGVYIFLGAHGLYNAVRARRWIPRLKQGSVLDGVVVQAKGHQNSKNKSWFHLWVVYEFTSPTGVLLSRKQYYCRDDPKKPFEK